MKPTRKQVEQFLAVPVPEDPGDARDWARGLGVLGKLAWIHAARAALDVGLRRRQSWPAAVQHAVRAMDAWIASPGDEAADQAAAATFQPAWLMNCDDLGNCVRSGSARLARAAGTKGTVDDAAQVIALMCHPQAFDMSTTMAAIGDALHSLTGAEGIDDPPAAR